MTLAGVTRWRWLLAVLLLAGLAFALRPLAPHEGPENWFPNADKLHHLWFFALLWWLALRAGVPRGWPLGLALLVYGAGVEVAQGLLTTSRSASLLDVFADGAGVLLGAVLSRWMSQRAGSSGQPQEHRR